mgnify:CR=1 FL=1
MNRSHILSNFRTEFRRKGHSYKQEVTALSWIRRFLDEFDIEHDSQVRQWQADLFLSNIKQRRVSFDDQLQAKSSIIFLLRFVLRRLPADPDIETVGAGVIKITA